MFTKVSICLLLLRIGTSKRIIVPIKSMIWFLVGSNVVLTLLWILQCVPAYAAWDSVRRRTARCMSKGQIERVIMAQASKIVLQSDFLYLLLTLGKSYPLSRI